MFDVVTVGSATQDVFVKTDAGRIFGLRGPEQTAEYLAVPYRAKVNVQEVLFMTGGGATNAAVCLSKQGLKAAVLAPLGDDDGARGLRERLARDGIDLSLLVTIPGAATAYSVILTSFEGDRTVLVHRGASERLTPEHLDLGRACDARWLYVASLGSCSATVYPPLFAAARRAGARLAWNPGNATLEQGLAASAELLRGLDVLLVNREEALTFLGRDAATRRGSPEVENQLYTDLLRAFQAAGVRTTIITDSWRGAYGLRQRQRVFCPATPVDKVVSTLGAGDAFGSTLVAGLHLHDDLPRAMREASINSASVVSVFGAKRGLLERAEIDRRYAVPPAKEGPPVISELAPA